MVFGSGEGKGDTNLVGAFTSEALGDGHMNFNSSNQPWVKEKQKFHVEMGNFPCSR